jgi:hypothetical protein
MIPKKLTINSIKQILNHSTQHIDESTIANLRAARTRALERHHTLQDAPVLAWLNHHGLWLGHSPGHHKHTNWALALILITCLFSGLAYWQHTNEHDHSDIDIAILTDDLPVDAYVEK